MWWTNRTDMTTANAPGPCLIAMLIAMCYLTSSWPGADALGVVLQGAYNTLASLDLSVPGYPSGDGYVELHYPMLCLVNVCRLNCGLSPLALNGTLQRVAQTHTNMMVKLNEMSHQLPGEPQLGDRFREFSYEFRMAGENVAKGYTTVQSVMEAWIESPEHFENIRGNYIHVGFARNDTFWSQEFGMPQSGHGLGLSTLSSDSYSCNQYQGRSDFDMYKVAQMCASKCGWEYEAMPPITSSPILTSLPPLIPPATPTMRYKQLPISMSSASKSCQTATSVDSNPNVTTITITLT